MASAPVGIVTEQGMNALPFIPLRVREMGNAFDAVEVLVGIFSQLKGNQNQTKALLEEGKEILKQFRLHIQDPKKCIEIANERIGAVAQGILGAATEKQQLAKQLQEWLDIVTRYSIENVESKDQKDQKGEAPLAKAVEVSIPQQEAIVLAAPLIQSNVIVQQAGNLQQLIHGNIANYEVLYQQLMKANKEKLADLNVQAEEHKKKVEGDLSSLKTQYKTVEEAYQRQIQIGIDQLSLAQQQITAEQSLQVHIQHRIDLLNQENAYIRDQVNRLNQENNNNKCIIL